MTLYRDRFIECTEDEVVIHWYYFPWGTKRVPYSAVKSFSEVPLSAFRGKGRIWGTGNFRYWASLDPRRPKKSAGLILDLGKSISPFITPDDADAVAEIISSRTGQPPSPAKAPFV
jgi:hypothetical protein